MALLLVVLRLKGGIRKRLLANLTNITLDGNGIRAPAIGPGLADARSLIRLRRGACGAVWLSIFAGFLHRREI